MNNYYKFPYDKVHNFLENNVSNDVLDTLYKVYDIEEGNISELANVISDEQLLDLGYNSEEKEIDNSKSEYAYSDVMDIARFLAHDVDSYITQQLIDRYQCVSFEDLAMALTDAELSKLGYRNNCCCITDEPINDYSIDYNICDYDDNLDYLEDIPTDIAYMVVDPEEGIIAVNDEIDYNRFKESLDPVLIDECSPLPDIVDVKEYLFKVTPKKFDNKVAEEVIINDKLNPVIFKEDHTMIPEIRERLLNYVNGFIDKMTDKGVDLQYTDIYLIGSNAGYLYTPESDIDIHILSAKQIEPEVAESLFDECDIYEAENPLQINDYNVELGIEDGYDIVTNNKEQRKYSLINDGWVDNSDDFENYKPEDISKVEGYEEIVNDYTDKINSAVDNDEYNQAVLLKQEIRQNRSDDLANIGSLSMGNVVFKELRNNGSYGKLRTYILNKDIIGEQQDE